MTRTRIAVPNAPLADLCRRYQVHSLALFGSVLSEDFRPDSDVDVLVDFDPNAQIGFIALARLQRELAELLGRPVDLVPKRGLKPIIRDQVLASAEEIYAA
jgi:predicted nucleotidyltransferase